MANMLVETDIGSLCCLWNHVPWMGYGWERYPLPDSCPLCHVDLAKARYKGTHTGAHKPFRFLFVPRRKVLALNNETHSKKRATHLNRQEQKVHVKVITANNIIIGHCLENACYTVADMGRAARAAGDSFTTDGAATLELCCCDGEGSFMSLSSMTTL
jgi:hypothetical protein